MKKSKWLRLRSYDTKYKWLAFLIRGLATLAFAALLMIRTPDSLDALISLCVIYLLVDGVLVIAVGLFGQLSEFISFGLLSILLASYTLANADDNEFFFVISLTAWTLLRGIFEISAAHKIHRHIHTEWFLAASGSLSLLYGMGNVTIPEAQTLPLLWVFITYLVGIGILWGLLSIEIRALLHHPSGARRLRLIRHKR